jgi:hypothetical protein
MKETHEQNRESFARVCLRIIHSFCLLVRGVGINQIITDHLSKAVALRKEEKEKIYTVVYIYIHIDD